MAAMGYVLLFAGAMKQAQAERRLGEQKNILANYKADQLTVMAGQSRAGAQRVALERQRRARLANSRALALAAASGGGAGDVGMNNIYAGIDAEGEYASEMALYEGEERARNYESDAWAERHSGAMAENYGNESANATMLTATGKLIGGFSSSSLTTKYSPVEGDAYQPSQSYYGNYPS